MQRTCGCARQPKQRSTRRDRFCSSAIRCRIARTIPKYPRRVSKLVLFGTSANRPRCQRGQGVLDHASKRVPALCKHSAPFSWRVVGRNEFVCDFARLATTGGIAVKIRLAMISTLSSCFARFVYLRSHHCPRDSRPYDHGRRLTISSRVLTLEDAIHALLFFAPAWSKFLCETAAKVGGIRSRQRNAVATAIALGGVLRIALQLGRA